MEAELLADPVHAASERSGLRVPSVLRCGIAISLLKAALAIRGFEWTVNWIRRRTELMPSVQINNQEEVLAIEYAVAMAGALYLGRALCLEQSLVLYYFLRRRGVPASFRMGVSGVPFAAHAWVEYKGEPLNDVREHIQPFALLPDVLP
jgi:Transglutaminase-like superfamily